MVCIYKWDLYLTMVPSLTWWWGMVELYKGQAHCYPLWHGLFQTFTKDHLHWLYTNHANKMPCEPTTQEIEECFILLLSFMLFEIILLLIKKLFASTFQYWIVHQIGIGFLIICKLGFIFITRELEEHFFP